MIAISTASALPTMDGDPSDWGPAGFLTGDWKVNATWVPNASVQFIVEDNRNPRFGGITGVHIQGTGSSYSFYDEPLVQHKDGSWVSEPYGGEPYDLEAMYFQQDADYVYLLIVTSLAPDGKGDQAPGDLRINVNKTKNSGDGYKYELGVKLENYYKTGIERFNITEVSDWAEIPNYIPGLLPARIVAGTSIDRADGDYVTCPVCNLGTGEDQNVLIYIIELAIPKSAIGGSGTYNFGDFSLTDNCTNDSISIPEFAAIAMPVAAIIGLVFVLGRRRKEH